MRWTRLACGITLLVLFLLQLYVNNIFSLTLLAVGIFLPVLSVVLCVIMHKKVSADLSVPEGMIRGQRGEIPIRIRFRDRSLISAADVSADISVTNTLTGTSLTQPVHCSVSGRSTRIIGVAADQAEVGRLLVSATNIRVSDLFRLVSFPVGRPLKNSFVVEAPIIPVDVVTVEARELPGDSDRYSENEPGNDVSEVFELREYVPGDDIRAIHWKKSAKTGDLVVREFGKQLTYSAVLLVEFCQTTPAALETAAAAAINLSRGLLETGIYHTLAWYDKASDELFSCNVTGYEDLDAVGMRLISSSPHTLPDEALSRFLSSTDVGSGKTLIYVTTSVEGETVSAAVTAMPTKIVLASDGEDLPSDLPLQRVPEDVLRIERIELTI